MASYGAGNSSEDDSDNSSSSSEDEDASSEDDSDVEEGAIAANNGTTPQSSSVVASSNNNDAAEALPEAGLFSPPSSLLMNSEASSSGKEKKKKKDKKKEEAEEPKKKKRKRRDDDSYSLSMGTKNISVNGTVFSCPVGWTVDQAEARIRSRFGLQFGGLEADSIPQLGDNLISNITGTLAFAGGQPVQVPTGGPMEVAHWKEQFLFELSSATVDTFSEGMIESIHGEHLLVKKLPEVFTHRYGSIPEKVYVRDCYRTLYKLASDSMVDASRNFGATLFTGVPGIGKSLFLVYFIFRFLSDERFTDKSFTLEFGRGKYVCFLPTGAQGEFWCSKQDGAGMPSKHFLLLCDLVEVAEPFSRAKWTYIFSSPAPDRYKETLKNSPSQEYTLPTWSELELMFVSGADNGRWYEDFALFGGVPRYIFPNASSRRVPRKLLKKALEEKGGALAESFFKFGFGMTDWQQNYMLVHINPPVSAVGDFDYSGDIEYTFASDAIFHWLAEKHGKQMLAGAVGMFNVGAASDSYGAVSAGKLFEKVCLWLKPLDGMRFTAASLSDAASTSVFEVPSAREVLPHDWKKTSRLAPGVLYVPRISNLESGDSFYLALLPAGGYLLVVLQITVGKSHPVKVNGLHDILLAYVNNVRAQVVSKALVFVLPAWGVLDGEQALHTQKEETMDSARVPVAVRDFEQFVYRHTI
eukprot:gene30373-36700_t